jgi:cystathionine beta-lyase/cystathionine gamma-synthase
MAKGDTIIQSFQDISDDAKELQYLITTNLERITKAREDITSKEKHIPKDVLADAQLLLSNLAKKLKTYSYEAVKLGEIAEEMNNLEDLLRKRDSLYNLIRIGQAVMGAVVSATDWQSPSFLFSLYSQAGRQTGNIKGTINDYKRDQHIDQKVYEERFLKEYMDVFMKSALQVYAVNSGMAALSTILTFINSEKHDSNAVFLGKGSYFENKSLIKSFYHDNTIEFNETDIDKFSQLFRRHRPSVILFDSLSNNSDITIADTHAILTFLAKNVKKDTFVVIDNTGLSFFLQPLSLALYKNIHIRLIVFESLNKYHQFGMDRVTGGIIWSWGKNTGKLYDARDHAGTNISDNNLLSLPFPNRKVLEKRMMRQSRNAGVLASSLSEYVTNFTASPPFQGIQYPGLPTHKGYSLLKSKSFFGSYFVISLKKRYQKISTYQRFVNAVIKEAKRQRVQIVSGTSFGMNTSRIYLTALRATPTEPFIRFASGTETLSEVEKIQDVLLHVMHKFS